MSTSTTGQDHPTATERTIALPAARRHGVAKIVVLGWVIAALGVGFALGRLLPTGLLG